jgi:ceramide glucosyltransferase
MYIELALGAAALVLLFETWRSHRRQRAAIKQADAPAPQKSYPSISVIRPIKGLDAGVAENFKAALDHGYPGEVETLFVFDDAKEPALPHAREAIAEHRRSGRPGTARIVFCGEPPAGRTGKLNAMIVAMRQSRGELVAFVDSDVRQSQGSLTQLVDTLLNDREAGSAFAPVVVSEEPRTVGDVGYSLLLNGLYGPAAALTTEHAGGELPFIMGQFMVFRREAIAAIGGLESAEGQLVDDMYIGARVKAAGYRNKVSPARVRIVQEGLPTSEFVKTFIRWITFSRSGLPGKEFKFQSWIRGTIFWLGLVTAAAALATGSWLVAALAALVPVGIAASINSLHERFGGAALPLRYLWVSFVVLLTSPAVYLSVFTNRKVTWRGRSYDLDAGSRLSEGRKLGADEQLAPERDTPLPARGPFAPGKQAA